MHALPGERSLAAGQNELKVAFESDPVGGVKLVKTYTFHRGDYVDRRPAPDRQRVAGADQPAPVPATRPRRQRSAGRLEHVLHLHRPGDLHRGRQVQEDRLQVDREARPRRQARSRHQRRDRLGGDGAALLHLGLAGRQARRAAPAREFFTAQDRDQHVLGRRAAAARRDRARRDQDVRCAAVRRPAGRRQARGHRARPRAGQGLRLVHDPRQAAVLAADAAAQDPRQLGLVDRRRWSCC